eukprot:3265593-Rhodomonas_salina.1
MSLGPNSRRLPVLSQQSESVTARPPGGDLSRQVLAGGPAYTTVDPCLSRNTTLHHVDIRVVQ